MTLADNFVEKLDFRQNFTFNLQIVLQIFDKSEDRHSVLIQFKILLVFSGYFYLREDALKTLKRFIVSHGLFNVVVGVITTFLHIVRYLEVIMQRLNRKSLSWHQNIPGNLID